MTGAYTLNVGGHGEAVPLDVDDDLHAVLTAFGARTAHGHALTDGARFLGYFDAGEGRVLEEAPMRQAVLKAIAEDGP